ncbi:MAG: proton-conducting transporter membrane subunit [Aquificaceae bacterium]|uniref:proton-conducting transporter transmembrane domain-containing protein n=1 Tax=Hydrogenobacter sp. Uz 6-8 TaxID=3384828 RepID=UPI0030A23EE8
MDQFMVLSLLFSSFVASLIIAFLKEEWYTLRTLVNIGAASYKLLVIGYLLWAVYNGRVFEISYPMVSFADFYLKIDPLGLLFVSLSSFLWLLTTLYAVGYLEGSPNRRRFFTFFNLAVTSTMGIALAGNMFTFFLFYELLTLSTYPLVVHRGTEKALKAGGFYLLYTVSGGTLFLVCLVFLYIAVGNGDFHVGGNPHLRAWAKEHPQPAVLLFYGLFFGMAVKAAVFPLHGWLTRAMVAPAPVSALLHAVAVVKAGAFGVVRLVYDLYGVQLVQSMNLWQFLAYLAGFTIAFGSLMAVFQSELKKRLAYSTISHLSYIILGILIPGPVATMGALLHLVNHGIMKITLFMCVGNYSEAYGIHRVEEVNGVGRRMPLTTLAFTLASLGLIGVPLTAGYLTKKYLEEGARFAGQEWAVYVLYLSSFLSVLYLIPIAFRAWFGEVKLKEKRLRRFEVGLMMLVPPLITGILTLLIGLSAEFTLNPLAWVRFIARIEYGEIE